LASEAQKFGYIKEGKVFLKGYRDLSDREIGILKESEESTFKYFEDRFETAVKKVDDLEKLVNDSVNKGSYLMKLLHLKKYLTEYDALGDFNQLLVRLEKLEEEIGSIIAKNREKNLEIKQALISEIEALDQIADWKESTERLKEIKSNWVKTGSVAPERTDEVEGKMNDVVQKFFERKQAYFEDRNQLLNQRIERYESLIKDAESLKNQEADSIIAKVKSLQEEWKKVGKIPQLKRDELWGAFKKVIDNIFFNLKRAKRKPKIRHSGAIIEDKQKLLGIVQKLSLNPGTVYEMKTKIKQLQNDWKAAGHIPNKAKAEDMNKTFFFHCDLALEKSFLEKLVSQKVKPSDKNSDKGTIGIKIKILSDLLSRDEKDLHLFQENMQKMNIEANSFSRMMDNKLNLQIRKVEVKRQILKELREQQKSL
jgi:hypothetical protein